MSSRITIHVVLFLIAALSIDSGRSVAAQSEIRGPVASVRSCSEFLVSHRGKIIAVRVAGIDCPALIQPFGPEAKAFVATLLNKRTVIVRPTGHDRHRRVSGDVLFPMAARWVSKCSKQDGHRLPRRRSMNACQNLNKTRGEPRSVYGKSPHACL